MQRLFDGDTGVVEGHVEPAVGGHGTVDEGLDLGFLAHVGGNIGRGTACGANLVLHLFAKRLTPTTECNLAAFAGEGFRGRATDARCGARDRDDLVFKASTIPRMVGCFGIGG